MTLDPRLQPATPPPPIALWASAMDYAIDAAQRSVLFWDVMRQRGNQYREHLAEKAPHVLKYSVELVADGRTFEKPVNYALARVIPPKGVEIDPKRRPFVVVDPRAGHGPGIGGFKSDSEIGVAMKAGHPCYFIGFLPDPAPGQTIEDIARAEGVFLEKVIALHPEADGKPCVIGNCQAGWAIAMLAAIRPELFGPLILAGSPLSYWAGVRGQNPMRYTGGLLGGSWLTALASDLGRGLFDGAWLVQNFENLNPSNTLWSKPYNLYAEVDTEAERYLDFERWWGGHVLLNAEEIQFIVDELFIGNDLAAGRIETSGGVAVDLRNIRSPIVVFCSKADNITPPPQALGWILDLYKDVDQIRSYGQTIVYTIHETAGHLGIFVSGGVARKEHDEFASNIDFIDTLPPGLYEAVFQPKKDVTENQELVKGDWAMRCEPRTLDDIRALGGHEIDDERRFATAARVSEINLANYRANVQPLVRAAVSAPMAEWIRRLHPLRLQYELAADANPFMAALSNVAESVRERRKTVDKENVFWAMQEAWSKQIVAGLDAWRDLRDGMSERIFMSIYGSPALQTAAGLDRSGAAPSQRAPESPMHREFVEKRIADLKSHISSGGLREALVRAALYVGMSVGTIDERTFELVRRIRLANNMPRATLAEFKKIVREQYYMLLFDREAALAALPKLLPGDQEERRQALKVLDEVLSARGRLAEEAAGRYREIADLFDVGGENQSSFAA